MVKAMRNYSGYKVPLEVIELTSVNKSFVKSNENKNSYIMPS